MSRRRSWFEENFGPPISDVRNKLIEEAWFGRHPGEARSGRSVEPEEEWDPVLAAKLFPDKINDKLFLHVLELDDLRSTRQPEPDRSRDLDIDIDR